MVAQDSIKKHLFRMELSVPIPVLAAHSFNLDYTIFQQFIIQVALHQKEVDPRKNNSSLPPYFEVPHRPSSITDQQLAPHHEAHQKIDPILLRHPERILSVGGRSSFIMKLSEKRKSSHPSYLSCFFSGSIYFCSFAKTDNSVLCSLPLPRTTENYVKNCCAAQTRAADSGLGLRTRLGRTRCFLLDSDSDSVDKCYRVHRVPTTKKILRIFQQFVC